MWIYPVSTRPEELGPTKRIKKRNSNNLSKKKISQTTDTQNEILEIFDQNEYSWWQADTW